MAFDITKPSVTDTDFAASFGFIRENFRAIVQGDSGVFTKLTVGSPTNIPFTGTSAIAGNSTNGDLAVGRFIFQSTFATGGYGELFEGAYCDATTANYKYRYNDVATNIAFASGTIKFRVAPSGTAGNTIAWTTAMTIDNTGKVCVGGTPNVLFEVFGTATAENFRLTGLMRFAGTNTTGAGSAALGANCPAVTATAPYTWIKAISSDGSTVYVPCWK